MFFASMALVPFSFSNLRLSWFLAWALYLAVQDGMGDDHFLQKVAPVLQRHCAGCHSGLDPKGDFSLDTGTRLLDSGFVERGDAAASHLMDVIRVIDGRAEMPKDGKPLSEAQVAAIAEWIDGGAPWPEGYVLEAPQVSNFDWWSFQPLAAPAVPDSGAEWARTPIDHFIASSLEFRGLVPSPEADRRTLIRRLTFDLTGLPPTPDEVTQFLEDPRPEAYGELVERLLASPQYGERWARHWLDVVKYADTHGYDKDKLRVNAWPYRDYVIRSFNEDKPYSRFVQEQIAGDVLFPGQPDGILGLGFIAAGPWDFIGHVEVAETKIDGKVARNLDRDDMVSNTFNTFCSVTIQCARCHNHKFDPISQADYYGLQTFFAAVDRADRTYDTDPEVQAARQELLAQQEKFHSEMNALEEEIRSEVGEARQKLELQIQQAIAELKIVKSDRFGIHSQMADRPDEEKWIQLDLPEPTEIATIVLHPCHDDFAGIGAGFGFPVRYFLEVDAGDGVWVRLVDRSGEAQANPGLAAIRLEMNGHVAKRVRLTATELRERSGDFHLALAELELLAPKGHNVAANAVVSASDSIEAPPRWALTNLVDGLWVVGETDSAHRLSDLLAKLHELELRVNTPDRRTRRLSLNAELNRVRQELAGLPAGKLVYAAASQFPAEGSFHPTMGTPREVFVLTRGNVETPGPAAQPRLLALKADDNVALPGESNEAERRAALARWLTRPDHPLVWRSIVNRIWQNHFGAGLVSSPNDFGRMGTEPTTFDLLILLAVEFRDSGQSFKQLHRLMVNSAVYRQAAADHDENSRIDSSNQYLWRMNRRRLSAEEVRDSILQVSGSLDRRMGGPGYYLFNLEKTEHSPHYEYHQFDHRNPESHRRSIYRFVVRSQPNPWMSTLDCADSSQSTPTRIETLTSLQALTLLNNDFNLVMAEKMAAQLEIDDSGLDNQVEHAVRLALQRSPEAWEREAMLAYAGEHGMANLCRLIFNMSEFVFVD